MIFYLPTPVHCSLDVQPDSGVGVVLDERGLVMMSWQQPVVQLPQVDGSLTNFTLSATDYQVSVASLCILVQMMQDSYKLCCVLFWHFRCPSNIVHLLRVPNLPTRCTGQHVQDGRGRRGHVTPGHSHGLAVPAVIAAVECHVSSTHSLHLMIPVNRDKLCCQNL